MPRGSPGRPQFERNYARYQSYSGNKNPNSRRHGVMLIPRNMQQMTGFPLDYTINPPYAGSSGRSQFVFFLRNKSNFFHAVIKQNLIMLIENICQIKYSINEKKHTFIC